MSHLTCEQLQQLTDCINERLCEFSVGDKTFFEPLSRGMVRLMVDVLEEFQCASRAVQPQDPETTPKREEILLPLPPAHDANVNGAETTRHYGDHRYFPTLNQMVAEVTRLAMGGVMPTMAVFNEARPATWSTAAAQILRLGLSWNELAHEAGLKSNMAARKEAEEI